MKVIYGISRIRRFRKPVVCLGVFDGVHLGHRQIINAAVKKSKEIKGTSIVITFWPHPQKENTLYSLRHRLRLIAELGVKVCVVIRFNSAFARITAKDFIKDFLIKRIGAHYIFVGRDFRFGFNAAGSAKMLKSFADAGFFKLVLFNVVKIGGRKISSTYIRRLIKTSKLNQARCMLSRPVSVFGRVIKGFGRSSRLGFPTANINPHQEVIPPSGVYACRVLLGKRKFYGACFISKKNKPARLEVHIFDFHKDIYNQELEIQFIKKIREVRKLKSDEELIELIKKDINTCRRLFSHFSSRHYIYHPFKL